MGLEYASTVIGAITARSAVVHKSVSTVVCALGCKECGGSEICEHGRRRYHARSAVGRESASTIVSADTARSAVGLEYASTVVARHECKECGGSSNLRARS